ncbi:ATP-binding protein, partial [bacterium]|nr:ATP-binding protein [bacterium]
MRDDIEQLLVNLKLKGIREIIERELERAEREAPSYAEFLAGLLRYEYNSQQSRFLEYRIRRAKLPHHWEIDTFPWHAQPGVRKAVIEQLAELDFIARGANIVLIGPTGVGKTGLAC